MTRAFTKEPVWTWVCDECGHEANPTARVQDNLPGKEIMESSGWFIAKLWGDKCPKCFEKEIEHG
jgi:hypothetical protein